MILEIIYALEIAIIFTANIFIVPLTGNKFNFTVSLVYMVFVAALYGFALVSRNKRAWLLKWGVSIPFSFLILQYFRITDYSIRALNWVFPGYGRPSGGGQFATAFMTILFTAMCLISGLISIFISSRTSVRFKRIQFIAVLLFSVLTVGAVLMLEMQFPAVNEILS